MLLNVEFSHKAVWMGGGWIESGQCVDGVCVWGQKVAQYNM